MPRPVRRFPDLSACAGSLTYRGRRRTPPAERLSDAVTELVVVDEHIFEKQGWKYVMRTHDVLKVPPGQVAPTDEGEVVRDDWEPIFEVRLEYPVNADEDVPDCVGLGLRTVADRVCEVAPDGSHDPDGLWVECYSGPSVHDGALMVWLDTDGQGFTREMIEAMSSVFVEQLTPCGVPLQVSAGTVRPDRREPWRSSTERNAEGRRCTCGRPTMPLSRRTVSAVER